MNQADIKVGMKVRTLVSMYNDLTDDGLGVYHCADIGDALIVRKVNTGYLNCITVSPEHIADRQFCCAPHEIEEHNVDVTYT